MPTALHDLRIVDKLTNEASRRPIRRRTVEIVNYQPTNPQPDTHLALEGTVTLLAARHGSRFFVEIREALANNDRSAEDLARRMYRQYKGRKTTTLSKGIKSACAEPVLADVLHGDMLLVESLFVPRDLEVAFIPLPYNGGRFADGGLRLVEHPLSEDVESLDILALAHAPSLSKAEQAALAQVPPEQYALNIGDPLGPRACGTGLLVAAVVVEVAVVAVTFAITGSIDMEHMDHMSAGELKKLGPAASARQLVQMRRAFLGRRTIARRRG